MIGLKIGGVPEHFNLPWRLAIEEKRFHDIDLELHWSDMSGGTGQMIKGLQSGSIDIAVLLTEGITKSILEGLPARIVNVYVNSPLRWGVHVPVDSNYSSIEDLENRIFAISRFGSGSHVMALVQAHNSGWDYTKLKFNVIGDVYGGLWALENHEADGFLWEKYTTQPFVDQGKCKRIGEVITPWPCFVVAVREEIYQKHSDLINKMCSIAGLRANELKCDPNAIETLAWRYHLNKEDVTSWLSETEWNYEMMLQKKPFEKVVEILKELGLANHEKSKEWGSTLFVE